MSQRNDATSPPPQPFWQRPIVQQLVPWGTSVAFHLCIILLGLIVYKTAVVILRSVRQEQIIIPDTNLVEQADAGGVPNPGINADPTRAAAQGADETVKDSNDWAKKKSDTLVANLTQGSADQKADVTPIGVASKVGGSVTGLTDRGNSGGSLAPFGPAGAGGGQGKGLFGLPGGNVRRVVYVCDASGSMVTLQPTLNRELMNAISGLQKSQAFQRHLFRGQKNGAGDDFITIGDGSLRLAIETNKRVASDFLDRYEVYGSSGPLPALHVAFGLNPDLIFLLTDGDLDEADKVIAELKKMNAAKRVKINTILLMSDRPPAPGEQETKLRKQEDDLRAIYEGTLKQIAADNGGVYKLVRASDLQR